MQTGRRRGPEPQVAQETLRLHYDCDVRHNVVGTRRQQLEVAAVVVAKC